MENEKRTVGFPVIYEIHVNVFKQRNGYGVHCCFYLEQLISHGISSIKTVNLVVQQSAVHSCRERMIIETEFFNSKHFVGFYSLIFN